MFIVSSAWLTVLYTRNKLLHVPTKTYVYTSHLLSMPMMLVMFSASRFSLLDPPSVACSLVCSSSDLFWLLCSYLPIRSVFTTIPRARVCSEWNHAMHHHDTYTHHRHYHMLCVAQQRYHHLQLRHTHELQSPSPSYLHRNLDQIALSWLDPQACMCLLVLVGELN